jgi:hypothetical protein
MSHGGEVKRMTCYVAFVKHWRHLKALGQERIFLGYACLIVFVQFLWLIGLRNEIFLSRTCGLLPYQARHLDVAEHIGNKVLGAFLVLVVATEFFKK